MRSLSCSCSPAAGALQSTEAPCFACPSSPPWLGCRKARECPVRTRSGAPQRSSPGAPEGPSIPPSGAVPTLVISARSLCLSRSRPSSPAGKASSERPEHQHSLARPAPVDRHLTHLRPRAGHLFSAPLSILLLDSPRLSFPPLDQTSTSLDSSPLLESSPPSQPAAGALSSFRAVTGNWAVLFCSGCCHGSHRLCIWRHRIRLPSPLHNRHGTIVTSTNPLEIPLHTISRGHQRIQRAIHLGI